MKKQEQPLNNHVLFRLVWFVTFGHRENGEPLKELYLTYGSMQRRPWHRQYQTAVFQVEFPRADISCVQHRIDDVVLFDPRKARITTCRGQITRIANGIEKHKKAYCESSLFKDYWNAPLFPKAVNKLQGYCMELLELEGNQYHKLNY